jgi:hypothetical protein
MRLTLAALAVGLLLPAPSAALQLNGHFGLSYLRSDTWIERSAQTTSPRLDLDLGLSATGLLMSPEFMAWQLDAAWRRLSQSGDGQRDSVSNSLFFGGRASLFNGARSPVNLSLDAARSYTTFSASTSSDVTGETVSSSYGARAGLHADGLPTLGFGYRWNDYQNTIPGLTEHQRTVQFLDASTSLGASSFSMVASYNGELSAGSWTADQYDTHRAAVTARAPIAPGTELFLEEQYQLTTPASMSAPGALLLDNNYFRAFASNSGDYGDRQVTSYSYGRLLSQPAGGVVSLSMRQALRYEGDLLFTAPTFFTRWIVDASLNQARNGPTALDASGETLGLQVWWRRPTEATLLEVWAGPIIGFIQSSTVGDSRGHGLSGQARANQPWIGQDTSLVYRLDWADDLYGAVGSSLRQSLSASMSGGLLAGRYVATASAGSSRTTSPVLGDGASRSLSLLLNATFRDLTLDGNVSLDQGMEGSTPRDFVSDGLFIPAPFDSRTLQTYGRGTYQLTPGISATGQVRWLSSSSPGRPTLDQTELFVGLQYRYGAFVIALEDRYGWNETATGAYQFNQFMFRLYRQIGWGP